MGAEDTGLKLWDQAYLLLEARVKTDPTDYHRLAQQKAIEISDFLQEHGEEIDRTRPDIVTNLGKAVDALAGGVQDTLPNIQRSPITEAVTSFIKDDDSLDKKISQEIDEVLAAAKKKVRDNLPTPPGGWKPWLIGGGIAAGLAVVGYFWRSVK